MNRIETSMSVFERLRFVLVEPSHPGNVGAVARAMKTMGFSELVLVNPRFPQVCAMPDAVAFASGALDVLEGARITASLEQALEGVHFAAALSSRQREYAPPRMTPRQLAGHIASDPGMRAALVFGSERFGLSNQAVALCNALIHIPANPDYASLNLAQAAQVLAYECRMQVEEGEGGEKSAQRIGFQGQAATADQVEGMYAHLERALVKLDFLDPANPRKLMPRLRRLFARTQLETEEVNILRGIANKILDESGS